MTNTTCSRCKGKGRLKGVSFAGGVCAKCGGRGTVTPETAEAKAARQFINWATEEGARREVGTRTRWAADAARHLQRTAPERFAKAVFFWKVRGEADLVYATLLKMAEDATATHGTR